MNGGVQLSYLMNDIQVEEFMRLRKRVSSLSKKQKEKMS